MSNPVTDPTPPETPVRGRAREAQLAAARDLSTNNNFNEQVPAHALRRELDRLISLAPSDRQRNFAGEMNSFYELFVRWQKTKQERLDWSKVVGLSPDHERMVRADSLPELDESKIPDLLSKLAVIKLNGGLGTTMGLKGPKSAIEVRNGLSFLDLAVLQIRYLNKKHGSDIPLLLMNSCGLIRWNLKRIINLLGADRVLLNPVNTDEMTSKLIRKYESDNIDIRTFLQSVAPRISRESLLPIPQKAEVDEKSKQDWYPPGHGDLWTSLERTGMLDELLESGKEWVFVSNIDNLGASVDLQILQHLCDSDSADFLIELTPKTKSDIKGGTLIEYGGKVRLLEVAQVPSIHKNDFYSVRKFSTFNTNK
jgi:UTP--glucose-1-phosphate uridylyltransferase